MCALYAGMAMAATEVSNFNFDWKFKLGTVQGAEKVDFDDAAWTPVDLPHDFQINMPWAEKSSSSRGFKEMGEGWYRKTFTADPAWKGQRVRLDFEGIIAWGDVWVNGVKAGGATAGYLGFEIDVTKLLRYDRPNVVAVWSTTGENGISRWYTGGGIYRDVHLMVGPDKGFARHGVFVTTPKVFVDEAEVAIQVDLEGFKGDTNEVCVTAVVKSPEGTVLGETKGSVCRSNLNHPELKLPVLRVSKPKLWSCETPFLYTAEVKILYLGKELDRRTQRFGIRRVEFSPEFGLKLNGVKTTFRGVANHHDLGALGAAAFRRGIVRYVRTLKRFGFNAIRTSHNPYSSNFMDVCDEEGVLVVDEFSDKWSFASGSCMCSRKPFPEMWYHLLPEWVRRDRNHPCVILWSFGNELQCWDTTSGFQTDDWGVTTYKLMNVFQKRYDPTRLSTVAQYPAAENAIHWRDPENQGLSKPSPLLCATEIASQNYMPEKYAHFKELHPGLILFQSEASTSGLLGPALKMDEAKTVGYAYWGAVEYWGESDKWPKKGWNYSWISHALQPFPQAWLLKSYQTPNDSVAKIGVEVGPEVKEIWNDMVVGQKKVLSLWNFAEGTILKRIYVYSNAEEVELIVNGVSAGVRKPMKTRDWEHNVAHWDKIAYGKGGSIEAVARTGGKEVARDRIVTAGRPVTIEIECENASDWAADGMDLEFVNVYAKDAAGNRVPTAMDEVSFEVSGAATLYATDDGDHSTAQVFNVSKRKMHHGFAQAILRAARTPGKVALRVSSPTLGSQTVEFTTLRP